MNKKIAPFFILNTICLYNTEKSAVEKKIESRTGQNSSAPTSWASQNRVKQEIGHAPPNSTQCGDENRHGVVHAPTKTTYLAGLFHSFSFIEKYMNENATQTIRHATETEKKISHRHIVNTVLTFQIENRKTELGIAVNTIQLLVTLFYYYTWTGHRFPCWPYLVMIDDLGNKTDAHPLLVSSVMYFKYVYSSSTVYSRQPPSPSP